MALRCADVARIGDYYGRLFGTEITSAASNRSRVSSVGDSMLEPTAAESPPSTRLGTDHMRIAIKDFSSEAVKRILSERSIAFSDIPGAVRISHPDGIGIELAAAS
jgi:hypothetical protein